VIESSLGLSGFQVCMVTAGILSDVTAWNKEEEPPTRACAE